MPRGRGREGGNEEGVRERERKERVGERDEKGREWKGGQRVKGEWVRKAGKGGIGEKKRENIYRKWRIKGTGERRKSRSAPTSLAPHPPCPPFPHRPQLPPQSPNFAHNRLPNPYSVSSSTSVLHSHLIFAINRCSLRIRCNSSLPVCICPVSFPVSEKGISTA